MANVTIALAGTSEAATADYVCDGTFDDVQINAAIAHVESQGGGTVYFDPGTYNISTNVLVYNTQNINLIGAGADQTIIKTAADFSYTQSPDYLSRGAVSFYNVQNFDVEGIYVDARSGTSPENSGGLGILNGFQFASCSNGTIQNCTSYIHPGWSYAIWSRESDHLQILNNVVKGGESYADTQVEQEGIELYNGSNILVFGNTIENIGGSGIFLFSPNSTNELHDIQVLNNNISGTTWGIRLAHEGPRSVENVTISGNKLTDIGGIGIDLWNVANGNFSTPGPSATVDNPQHIQNIIIDHNDISLADRSELAMFRPDVPKTAINQAIGIYLDNETAPGEAIFQNIQVTNNQLTNTSVENGSIYVLNYAAFELLSNTITDSDPATDGMGVSISGSSDFALGHNSINGFGADGLLVQDSSNFTANNNSISGWTAVSGVGLDITGSSGFQAAQNQFSTNTSTHPIVEALASDLNGDLLWRTAGGDVVTWNTNAGAQNFASEYLGSVDSSWQIQGAGDFNDDGKADILWRHTSGEVMIWNSNSGASGFTGQDFGQVDASWQIQGAGDFNGDGKADILWRHTSGEVVIWNSNSGASGFTGQVDASWQIQGAGDFNGDGKADILWRHTSGEVVIWNSNSGASGFTGQDFGQVDASWQIQGAGDFNGDGKADILWRHTSGEVVIWNSKSGASGFTGQDFGQVDASWQIQGAGDFNGDGKADILWRHTSGEVVIWNSNSGVSGFTGQDLGHVDTSWQIQGIGDYDGDGKTDVAWRNSDGDVMVWNSNSSSGTLLAAQNFGLVDVSSPAGVQSAGVQAEQTAFDGKMLTLEAPSTFTGQIIGFAGDGKLAGSDQIDLRGFDFNQVHASFDSASGALSVSSGSNTTSLQFLGRYSQHSFHFADDGNGGTLVVAALAATQAVGAIQASNLAPQETFVFAPNFGQVILPNFAPATDMLQFSKTVFTDITALLAATHDDASGNAVITDAAHDTITLQHVTTAQLLAHQSDFHFV